MPAHHYPFIDLAVHASVRDHFAIVEDDDSFAEIHHHVHIVFDQYDRSTGLVKFFYKIEDDFEQCTIYSCGWFVEE